MGRLDAQFDGQIFRKDHPMVIATNRHLATILAARLKYDANGYKAGQVLARNSSTGLFEKYSAASGSYAASCVLFEDVAPSELQAPTGTALARGIFGGELYKTALIDLNAQAITDLKAREIIDASGVNILKF